MTRMRLYSARCRVWMILILILICALHSFRGAVIQIKIGVLSNNMTLDEEAALNFSLSYANQAILANQSVELVAIRSSSSNSEFEVVQKACWQVSQGISAFLGIFGAPFTRAIALIADTFQVPVFAPKTTNPLLKSLASYPYLIRQSPPDSVQSMAIADLIDHFKWTRMSILTSDSEYGLNGLSRLETIASVRHWTVYSVQRFASKSNVDEIVVRPQLLNIKASGVRIVVLHCNAAAGRKVLQDAAQLDMTSAGWQWIVTNGITSSDLLLKSVNVSVPLRGLLGTSLSVARTAFSDRVRGTWAQATGLSAVNVSPLQGVVMDAVFSIAYTAASFPTLLAGEALSCSNPSLPWSNGSAALLAFNQVSGDGMMGRIEYRSQQPKTATFDVVSLVDSQWQKVGTWYSGGQQRQGLQLDNKAVLMMGGAETVADFVGSLRNRTLRVVFMTEPGFIETREGISMADLKNASEVPIEWLQGYCIDLLVKLQDIAGFQSSLYVTPDESFGNKDAITGEWNGMMRELVELRADMAVGSMTINRERKTDVDFTAPYIDLGLQFILKKRETVQDSFRFLAPLSLTLWGYIAGTLFIVSFVIAMINKLSPFDFHGGFIQEDHRLSKVWTMYKKYLRAKKKSLNAMDFANSLWMSVATLMQQGAEIYPMSVSGKITAGLWFLLALLVISTYTANLSAFLTQSRLVGNIDSIDELGAQNQIKYGEQRASKSMLRVDMSTPDSLGAVKDSAVLSFFAASSVAIHQTIYNNIQLYGTELTNTDEGIRRARAGGFAFIHDSIVLNYEAQKSPCELRLVGQIFGKLGYGFGLQQNSPFHDELSIHISQLRERGFMDALWRTWLTQQEGCADTDQQATTNPLNQLGVTNVLGVFYIIYVGLASSFVILVLEWIIACVSDVITHAAFHHNPDSVADAFQWRRKKLWDELVADFGQVFFCASSPVNRKPHYIHQNGNTNLSVPDDLSDGTDRPGITINSLRIELKNTDEIIAVTRL